MKAVLKVTIYGKEDCCLCHQAKAMVQKLQDQYNQIVIEEIDITTDQELWARYWDRIPVVALNGEVKFQGKVAELWLKRAVIAAISREIF